MNSNTMYSSFTREISVVTCVPYIDDDYIDVYKMYIYKSKTGDILAAINKDDGEIIINELEIDVSTAERLFNEFKAFLRNDKIDQII